VVPGSDVVRDRAKRSHWRVATTCVNARFPYRGRGPAEQAHPLDPAVVLGVVRLLFDDEAAIAVVTAEAVGDALAVGE
jgi:hypothetical protein